MQARGRFLARLAQPLVVGEHRDLRVVLHLSLGDTLEALVLPALPLGEHHVEPRPDVRLRLFQGVGDGGLARAEPLGDLLDRAAALDRLGLELVERLGDRLPCGPFELLAKPEYRPALLVGRRAELGGFRLEASRDLRERVPVSLLERASWASRCRCARSRSSEKLRNRSSSRRSERASSSTSASPARRSRSTCSARRSSARRRSSAARRDAVSARSRASTRRISSVWAAVSALTASRTACCASETSREVAVASARAFRTENQRTTATATAATSAAARIQMVTRAG